LAFLVELDAWFDLPWSQGGMAFAIEKPQVLIVAILSFELVICHPYDLI
jgi:hypothetical protein